VGDQFPFLTSLSVGPQHIKGDRKQMRLKSAMHKPSSGHQSKRYRQTEGSQECRGAINDRRSGKVNSIQHR